MAEERTTTQRDIRRVHELLAYLSRAREVMWALVIAFLATSILRVVFFQAMSLSGPAMSPAIGKGDRFMIYRAAYVARRPARGHIVSYHISASEAADMQSRVGRVVALGGEVVSMRDGALYVNGNRVKEDYVEDRARYDLPLTVVPRHSVFILADSRNKTTGDSHAFGPVPAADVDGRVWFCFAPVRRIGVFREPDYGPGLPSKPSA